MKHVNEQDNVKIANEIKGLYINMVNKYGIWYTRGIIGRYTDIDFHALEAEIWPDELSASHTVRKGEK